MTQRPVLGEGVRGLKRMPRADPPLAGSVGSPLSCPQCSCPPPLEVFFSTAAGRDGLSEGALGGLGSESDSP